MAAIKALSTHHANRLAGAFAPEHHASVNDLAATLHALLPSVSLDVIIQFLLDNVALVVQAISNPSLDSFVAVLRKLIDALYPTPAPA